MPYKLFDEPAFSLKSGYKILLKMPPPIPETR
jgi:hypothetical protein